MLRGSRISVLAAGLVLLGCGGGGGQGSANLSHLTYRTPPAASLPAGTADLRIEVLDPLGNSVGKAVVAVGVSEAVIANLPSGPVVVEVFAEDSSKTTLASGQTSASLVQSSHNLVTVGLNPVPPPVPVQQNVLSGAVAAAPSPAHTARISLNAIIDPTTDLAVVGLAADSFRVFEDGIARTPISVSHTASVAGAKVDICFVLDTTDSTNTELRGVEGSVTAFADNLTAAGIDARFAGIEFADEVRSKLPFTSSDDAFASWVKTLVAFGGGDMPDNPLDAIKSSLQFSWRPDAQHIILVITDSPMHEAGDGTSATSESAESVAAVIKGGFVVDSVSPPDGPVPAERVTTSGVSRRIKYRSIRYLASLVGGMTITLPSDGHVDLSELGIPDIIKSGYVIDYPTTLHNPGVHHSVRLVMSKAGTVVADQHLSGRY